MRRCLDCRLVWRSAPLGQPVTSIYDDDYFGDGGYYQYFARPEQWRFEARRRLRWMLAAATPRRLLEVGCAGGFFLEAAARAGIAVQGVELTRVAAAYAREQLDVPVTEGAFEDLSLPGPFDALCAFHVLEHVADPERFLGKARKLLVPGGWLALEVPNIEAARARREGSAWGGLVPEHHLWHFSPGTLVRLLEQCGFTVRSCETVFPRHYFRLRTRLSRAGVANLFHDWRDGGSPRTTHPSTGDMVRVLARASDLGGVGEAGP